MSFRGAKRKSNFRSTLSQILAVCVKNTILIAHGMSLGFPTILIPSLPNENKEILSWIGSIGYISEPIGGMLSGFITQPFGRKKAMQLVDILFLTSWMIFYFSNEIWQILIALSLCGFNGGLLEAPIITYVAEISQPHLRGTLTSTSTMCVTLGIMLEFLLGSFLDWRTAALINCIPPTLSFILLLFIPETPYWLISKGKYKKANKSLRWLRGWTTQDQIQNEFDQIKTQIDENKIEKKFKLDYLKLFLERSFFLPYFLVSFAFFLGHFNGTTPLQTYAVNIFKTLNVFDSYYATVIMGTAQFLGCITCVTFINITGKRLINFITLIMGGICWVIVGVYSYMNDIQNLNEANTVSNNWIPTTFLVIFAYFSNVGIRILPWLLCGEVYSNETRSFASGFSAGTGYVIGFLSNKVFFLMVSALTLPGVFCFFAAINFVGFILLYFILPETEGKSLFVITQHFAGKGRMDNKVLRNVQNTSL